MEKLRRLREGLKQLRCAGPGRRFQAHYEEAHEPRGNYGMRALLIVGGVAMIPLGLLLSIIPLVPGTAVCVVGAGLVAAESRTAARFLDWIEVKVRQIAR